MSTYYRPSGPISLAQVKRHAKDFEVVFIKEAGTDAFFDGENYLHFQTSQNGDVIDIYRYGNNDPTKILDELERLFGWIIWSEHDDEYNEYAHPETNVIQFSIPFREEPPEEGGNE